MRPLPSAHLQRPSLRRESEFIAAVRRSRRLHGQWVQAPSTHAEFEQYLRASRRRNRRAHWVCTDDGELAGVINVSEIVLGAFCSAYLGYYALEPYAGRGYLRAGLVLVIERAFGDYGLHRLEANIQPTNRRSVQLVRALHFKREGYSERYLKIAGRWRDHERWAITSEGWRESRRPG